MLFVLVVLVFFSHSFKRLLSAFSLRESSSLLGTIPWIEKAGRAWQATVNRVTKSRT